MAMAMAMAVAMAMASTPYVYINHQSIAIRRGWGNISVRSTQAASGASSVEVFQSEQSAVVD